MGPVWLWDPLMRGKLMVFIRILLLDLIGQTTSWKIPSIHQDVHTYLRGRNGGYSSSDYRREWKSNYESRHLPRYLYTARLMLIHISNIVQQSRLKSPSKIDLFLRSSILTMLLSKSPRLPFAARICTCTKEEQPLKEDSASVCLALVHHNASPKY